MKKASKIVQEVALFFLLVFVSFLSSFSLWATHPLLIDKFSVDLVIEQRNSFRQIAKKMDNCGLPVNAYLFELLARLLGKAQIIKAGFYTISNGTSPYRILKKITKGEVSYSVITIVEGWTFAQMRDAIYSHPDLLHDTHTLNSTALLKLLKINQESPEGLFFPDTYFFPKESSDLVIYDAAYKSMQNKLEILWRNRDTGFPLSKKYEVLILASLIEKETGRSEDRPIISGVFMNRLNIGMPLQTDPTVIYGLKKPLKKKGRLSRHDLRTYTPYNTYIKKGLPPTPIALPGLESIKAALKPMKTSSLYFVACGNGDSYFSSTLNEHIQAVNRLIKKKK